VEIIRFSTLTLFLILSVIRILWLKIRRFTKHPEGNFNGFSPTELGRVCYHSTEMDRWKRLLYYLLINVAVSACTILAVLAIWDRVNQPQVLTPAPVAQVVPTTAAPAEAAALETAASTPSGSTATPDVTGFETYEVQSGDTLGAIAEAYGVTVEEITAANNLESPDVLDVGDVLVIPVPAESDELPPTEVALPTNTFAPPTPPASGTSTPLPPGFDPEIEIVTVVAAGNLADERVVLRLNGDGELALLGWSLQDEDGNLYVFPELTLFKDGAVTVYSKAGTNNVVELFWGLGKAVWESGETVSLVDPQGNEQASYVIP
jgi:LysM repeat protein